MPLVDSIKRAKDSVGQAFDQLVQDVEAEEATAPDTDAPASGTVEKVTVHYTDGSSVEFAPPVGEGEGVKDLTEEAPVEGGDKSDPTPTPPAAGDQGTPGNSEQV